ncbi:UNVERIFIED_CONTAM: hypothetical protein Slati_1342700 [Sesamum latifolium]|uniref:Uncharacterized protein n=1 Tax=Sesamum latifolium TaxID=2727402 RepID=A0AAW2XLA0_9LAMI
MGMRKEEKMECALEMGLPKNRQHKIREWCDQGAWATGRLLQLPDHHCPFAIITVTL